MTNTANSPQYTAIGIEDAIVVAYTLISIIPLDEIYHTDRTNCTEYNCPAEIKEINEIAAPCDEVIISAISAISAGLQNQSPLTTL